MPKELMGIYKQKKLLSWIIALSNLRNQQQGLQYLEERGGKYLLVLLRVYWPKQWQMVGKKEFN